MLVPAVAGADLARWLLGFGGSFCARRRRGWGLARRRLRLPHRRWRGVSTGRSGFGQVPAPFLGAPPRHQIQRRSSVVSLLEGSDALARVLHAIAHLAVGVDAQPLTPAGEPVGG